MYIGFSGIAVRTASWRARGWRISFAALLVALCGCATAPAAPSNQNSTAPTAPQSGPKTLTIAFPIDPTSLGGSPTGVGAAAVPSRYFKEFNNAYLTTYDAKDELVPWLATDLPSLDDGTWKVLDDGRMEVTWKLRQNIKWHDGFDLTSDDVKFGWEIGKDARTAVGPQSVARYVESVVTPDPYTAIFTWEQASALGAQAGVREFDVLPRHLLDGLERVGLVEQPYFSDPAVFVGSGPYRTVAWERGGSIRLEAFDQYFLGRPKIDRVIFTLIPDAQAALANALSGQVDVSYWTISYEGARIIQQEWARSGGGTVEMQANNARHLLPQLRADYASPRDLLDVRVRKALMHAMDRTELAETAAAGAAHVVNSTTYPESALGQAVEARAIRYDFDPTRTAALFAEAGWQKGGDGSLSKGGERFELAYRTGAGNTDGQLIFAVLQQQYRRSGIELSLHQAASNDLQAEATFPGVSMTALPDNQAGFLARFNSATTATAQNRWAGNNRNGYANPAADELLNRVDRTLRRQDRMAVWAEANRVVVDDVAFFPLYNYPYPYVVRKGVLNATPGNPINPPTYFVHTWDLQ